MWANPPRALEPVRAETPDIGDFRVPDASESRTETPDITDLQLPEEFALRDIPDFALLEG
jgi:hypothetical protein